jgi:hypothetical protein
MKVFVFAVLCNIFLSEYMYKNKTDPFQTKQKAQLNKNKTQDQQFYCWGPDTFFDQDESNST